MQQHGQGTPPRQLAALPSFGLPAQAPILAVHARGSQSPLPSAASTSGPRHGKDESEALKLEYVCGVDALG